MAQTTNGLVLSCSSSTVTQEIFAPTASIDTSEGFNQATVENTDPNVRSFYAIYEEENYDKDAKGRVCLVPSDPLAGTSQKVCVNFVIRSAQGFDLDNPGIVLFQNAFMRGYAVQYRFSSPDVSHSFPPGTTDGASSLVCTGGTWELHTKPNYEGPMVTITPQAVYNLADIKLDDKIRSVKFIKDN